MSTTLRTPRSIASVGRKLFGDGSPDSTSKSTPTPAHNRRAGLFGSTPAIGPQPPGTERAISGVPISRQRIDMPKVTHHTRRLANGLEVDVVKFAHVEKIFAECEGRIGKDGRSAPQALRQLRDKLLDLHRDELNEALEDYRDRHVDAWRAKLDGWEREAREDPDTGRNRFSTTTQRARQVIAAFGTKHGAKRAKALAEAIDDSGLDRHPEWRRFMAFVADTLSKQG